MFALLLAVQTEIAGRPSGMSYAVMMAVTAVAAGILVALVFSRFERPAPGAEKKKSEAQLERSRPGAGEIPPAAKPQRAQSR